MAYDFYSIMSQGVHHDDATTTDEWAILGISYGFITDSLGEATSGLLRQIYTIGLLKFQWLTKRLIGGD